MKSLITLILALVTSVFALSALAVSQQTNSSSLKANKATSYLIAKKQKPDYCKAIENTVRNIRAIKQITQELDKYNDDIILACMKKLASDPSLRAKLKQLEPYLKSRNIGASNSSNRSSNQLKIGPTLSKPPIKKKL